MLLRAMTPEDRFEVAELIYSSINFWYKTHNHPRAFLGGPRITEIYYDVYNDVSPGGCVLAVQPETGRIMGSCFYHPREHHVSLGIMNVHPNYFGQGIGAKLVRHIVDFTERHGYPALRLTQSAINVDSFSLYTRCGFVPRYSYQTMFLHVPATGFPVAPPLARRIRPAVPEDVPAMAALEREVSGICRAVDYRYCIENRLGFWHSAVLERPDGGLDGFMISSAHPAANILGPCVCRDEESAYSLIVHELDQHAGRRPLFMIPMEKHALVQRLYGLGARNSEMHFCQVRGEFQPYRGVNMPTFLPETG